MVAFAKMMFGAIWLEHVNAHGFISVPEMRGRFRGKYRWEPQSLGATGGGAPIPVCGREDAAVGKSGPGDKLTKLPKGAPFTFEADIRAHHMGHMTIRLCPYLILTDIFDYDALDDCVFLNRTAAGGPGTDDKTPASPADYPHYWFLPPGKSKHSMTFDVPSHLPASPTGAYTLQYRWETANSCCPDPKAYKSFFGNKPALKDWCGGVCKDWGSGAKDKCTEQYCCSEVFTNCADVSFDGVEVKKDLLKDLVETSPSKPSKPKPKPRPPTGGGGGAKGRCVHQKDCKISDWCSDTSYEAWCPAHLKTEADCAESVQCIWTGAGGKPEPEPEKPEAEPEPEHPKPKHEIKANPAASAKLTGVAEFCKRNKKYFCSAETTVEFGGNLCACSPVPGPEPEPETETKPEPEPEPETKPTEKPKPKPTVPPGTFVKCTACKSQCQAACGSAVGINQCWGSPRYVHCKCKNGDVHEIPGCPCKHKTCPSLLQSDHTKLSDKLHQTVNRHEAEIHHDGSLSID